MTPSEQRQLILDAITALQAGAHIPDELAVWPREDLIVHLEYAVKDHAEDGCPAADGECRAAWRARQILAAQQEGAAA